MSEPFQIAAAVAALKAAAEPTRLRILALLGDSELNVKDLTVVLGQSQPRISRHLKLLTEAGLIERFREGSWVYFRLADRGASGDLARRLVDSIDAGDRTIERDRVRAGALLRERVAEAQAYFEHNAAEWDQIRAEHVSEGEVEAAMLNALAADRIGLFVDLGTGTGRILELFADRYERGIGIDMSHAMLKHARSRLERAAASRAQVRHGDLYHLPIADGAADAVVMHQVLHFLTDPGRAIAEAARVLAPGGTLLIVDFASHEVELLRERFQHVRLGFADAQIRQWLAESGIDCELSRHLEPHTQGGDNKLTVSVWLARRPGAADGAQRDASALRHLHEVRA